MRAAYAAAVMMGAGLVLAQPRPSARDAAFFDSRVAPILRKRCLGCHNDELKDGGVSFLDRDTLLRKGPHGPPIVPGDPQQSVLVKALRHDGDIRMPPGQKLPRRDIAIIEEWIRRGAVWGKPLNAR